MKMKINVVLVCLATMTALRLPADVLELKNGQVLSGKYLGGTAATLRFDTGSGLQVIETSLHFQRSCGLNFRDGGQLGA